MALRRITKQKGKSGIILKTLAYTFAGLFILCLAAILYFNGNKIKEPLEQFLSSRTGSSVEIEKVEFSAIYPNTLKLFNVKSKDFNINELYLEYDVLEALRNNNLIIDYLYIKKPEFKKAGSITDTIKISFDTIFAHRVHIEDTPVNFANLHSQKADLDIRQLSYGKDLSFSSMQYNLQNGSAHNLKFKTLSFNLREHGDVVYLDNLSMQTLGGTIQAQVSIKGKKIDAENVIASKLILKNLPSSGDYSLTLKSGRVFDTFLHSGKTIINNISGEFSNISYADKAWKGTFKGKAASIMYKNLPALTDSNINLKFNSKSMALDLHGHVIEGKVRLESKISSLDTHPVITIDALELNGCKVELTPEILSEMQTSQQYFSELKINNTRLNNISFLSFITSMPLSIRQLNATITGVTLKADDIKGDPAGLINIESSSLLYSDLYIKRIYSIATLTDDFFTLAIPELTFKKSSVALSGDISTNRGRSYLLVHAHNFDMSELNSSLLKNLFAGRINLDLELKSSDIKDISKLQGHLLVNSDSLLVSDFGLDLINGGDMSEYTLSDTSLLTALADADVGLNKLKLEGNIKNSKFNVSAYSSLSSCDLTAFGKYDFKDKTVSLEGYFKSLGGDSKTTVKASLKDNDLIFKIKPEKRGEQRPGLFIKKDLNAKEPQDRLIKDTPLAQNTETKAENKADKSPVKAKIDNKASKDSTAEAKADSKESKADAVKADKSPVKTGTDSKASKDTSAKTKPDSTTKSTDAKADNSSKNKVNTQSAKEGKEKGTAVKDSAQNKDNKAN